MKIETLTFTQFLNMKIRFLHRSIYYLENHSIKYLIAEGFSDKREIKDTIKFQKNDLMNTRLMIKFNKLDVTKELKKAKEGDEK